MFPGTFGSLAGLGVYFLVCRNVFLFSVVALMLVILGVFCATETERALAQKDSRYIVIDEVCGMLWSLYLLPCSFWVVILGFFLFRLFDTLKPFPITRLQDLSGGFGILADDLMAAFYTNVTLQAFLRLASKIVS